MNTSCRGEGNSFYSWDGEKILSERQVQFFLVLSVLIGCVLRCWNINQSFWWDEIWSTMSYAKASSIWQVMSSLGYYFNNHILYSLLARGSIKIFGESEFTARLPALFMGLLGIFSVFQFGKNFLGVPAGIVASLLLAISAFHIDHSSEARGYSGLALFSLLSSFYFLKGLKTDDSKSWMFYVLFTVFGFYSHVFMIAVSISQFCCALLFMGGKQWGSWKIGITPRAFKNFFLSLFLAGIITVLIFAPILSAFFGNIGKVRLVHVNRVPFILTLLNSFFPGIQSVAGSIIYGILFFYGIYYVSRKDPSLFLYLCVLSFMPVSVYLMINPMFVSERYFIFALPFVLLIASEGIVGLAGIFKGVYQKALVFFFILLLLWFQLPALHKIMSQDRQNYREAVYFVTHEVGDRKGDLIFSIGYAGEHFRYYSPNSNILNPETFADFWDIIQGRRHVWCLITAWLPDIRPPYEDKTLYAEKPGQVEIYNYVKKHFKLQKNFPSKYPVEIYCLQR